MFKVKFLPDEKEMDVQGETTLMEAAQQAKVHINNLCGGKGVCGKCRVKVTNGKIHADKHSISLLSKEEILEGYVLACQTKVDADSEILIPAESRLEEGQILMECSVDYSAPEKITLHRLPSDPMCLYEPLTQKVYLEMKKPFCVSLIRQPARSRVPAPREGA